MNGEYISLLTHSFASTTVLNYSEPPFCRALQDSDIILIQFALLCHASPMSESANVATDTQLAGLSYVGTGTSRLVNLLLHRFGIFDFLGCK